MFAAACKLAAAFTAPVVISVRTVNGKCQSSIGAFVVVNSDGWALTAHHILAELTKLNDACTRYREHGAQIAQIEGDANLTAKQKRRAVEKLGAPGKDHPTHYSVWWSAPGVEIQESISLPAADLALVRLHPFSPAMVASYPVFKDPARNFDPGTSLCRIGFPFHTVEPTYDATRNVFELPPGSVPLPRFASDGILSRIIEVEMEGQPAPHFVGFIETSSPGLRGQSGGPIFDRQGTIWGIQSKTQHYPLGFSPEVKGQREHQFLNAGWGTHAATVIGVLNSQGIAHQVSSY